MIRQILTMAVLSWCACSVAETDPSAPEVMDQEQNAEGESETDGYTLLDIYADYHFDVGNGELLLFAKGTNLLDENYENAPA